MYVSLLHIYHKDASLLLLMLEIKGWFQTKKKAVDVQRSFSHADIYIYIYIYEPEWMGFNFTLHDRIFV
jgi:hypothetical protein